MAGPERWTNDRDRARFGGGDRDFQDYGERFGEAERSFDAREGAFEGRGGTDAYAAGYGIPAPDDDRYGGQWGRGESPGYAGQDYGDRGLGGRFGQQDAEAEARARNFGSGGGRIGGDHDRTWMERAGERVAAFFGGGEEGRSHRGKGPKNYARADTRIRDDVNDRLTDDSWLDASDIEVRVENGEVTLSGTVAARQDKRRAEDLAEDVPGVKHVQNNLRIQASANPGGAASV